MQKKVKCVISLIVVVFLVSCSVEKVNLEKTEEVHEQHQELTNVQEKVEIQKKEILAETHLELVKFEDYTPYYCLSFQKIEGGTGNVLLFEGKTELEDQEVIEPINIEIEPYGSLWQLGWGFAGKENMADTVKIVFWNRGGASEVTVRIDGLEYRVAMPEITAKEIEVGQALKIDAEGSEAIFEKAVIYPNALLIKMSEMDYENWDTTIDLKDSRAQSKRMGFTGFSYDAVLEEMELLFVFNNGFPDGFSNNEITLLVNECETGFAKDTIYHEQSFILN